jgi:hypothetical protein
MGLRDETAEPGGLSVAQFATLQTAEVLRRLC